MAGKKLNMIELSGAQMGLKGDSMRIPGEAVFEVYRPGDSLESVTLGGRRLIRFGSTGAFGALLLDPSSGSVLESLRGEPDVNLVNTSLDAFNRCLGEFADKFPLEEIDDEGEAEERDNRVARQIEEEVRRIDPDAYFENGFWYELRWSVAIGDFSD